MRRAVTKVNGLIRLASSDMGVEGTYQEFPDRRRGLHLIPMLPVKPPMRPLTRPKCSNPRRRLLTCGWVLCSTLLQHWTFPVLQDPTGTAGAAGATVPLLHVLLVRQSAVGTAAEKPASATMTIAMVADLANIVNEQGRIQVIQEKYFGRKLV